MMKKRAIVYGRVSGDDRGKEGRNLAGQIEGGRLYCSKKDYRIVKEMPEDVRGASGSDSDLPMLNEAIAMAARDEFDVFVCREVDRLSRDVGKMYLVKRDFEKADVAVEYYKYEFPNTPVGEYMEGQFALAAQLEAALTKERTVRARRLKVRGGSVLTHGNPPFGFSIHKDGGHTSLVVNEKEAATVRKVFDLYTADERLSISGVARAMEGTPSCTDLRHNPSNPKKRKYGHWSAASISHILGNPVYIGRWEYGADKIEVEIPCIISEETWGAVQERKRTNTKFARRNQRYHFMLSKHLTCACGSAVLCTTRKWKGIVYPYYFCGRSSGLQADKCSASRFWRADHIDETILDWLTEEFSNPDNVRKTIEQYIKEEYADKERLIERIGTIKELLAQNEGQLRRFVDAYADNPDLPKEWLAEKTAQHKRTFVALDQELNHWEELLQHHQFAWEVFESIGGEAEYWHDYLAAIRNKPNQPKTEAELIEGLDVQGVLQMNEDGAREILATCRLGERTLSVAPTHLRTRWPKELILSKVIILSGRPKRKPFTHLLPLQAGRLCESIHTRPI